jgi:hypothetical protein
VENGIARVFFLIAFLLISIAFVLFPKQIQQYYLGFYRRQGYSDDNLLLRWMRSSLYIVLDRSADGLGAGGQGAGHPQVQC